MDIPYNTSQPRLEKAIKLINNVCPAEPGKFYVQSDSNPRKFYEIYSNIKECGCEDSSFRGIKCWHLYAVELFNRKNIV